MLRVRYTAETWINKFDKTSNICAAFKKVEYMFLGPNFTKKHAEKFEHKLHSLKYKRKYSKPIACHKNISQQIQNLNANSYAGIDIGTNMCFFLSGIDELSL